MRLLCSVLSDRGTTAAKGQIHLSVMKLGRKSLAVCCGVNSHSVLLPIAVTALVRTLVCILFCKHQTFRRCPNSRRLHRGEIGGNRNRKGPTLRYGRLSHPYRESKPKSYHTHTWVGPCTCIKLRGAWVPRWKGLAIYPWVLGCLARPMDR